LKIKLCIVSLMLVSAPLWASAQNDPREISIMKKAVEGLGKCPEGRECATIDAFTRTNNKGEVKRYVIGQLAAERGFDRVVIMQHIGGKYGVIVNSVKVGQSGKWIEHTQGIRLPEGRTELTAPIPVGTPEITISFDHGHGAEVTVSLERRKP